MIEKKRGDAAAHEHLPQTEQPMGGPGPEERDLPLSNEEITQRIEEFERGKAEMDRKRGQQARDETAPP